MDLLTMKEIAAKETKLKLQSTCCLQLCPGREVCSAQVIDLLQCPSEKPHLSAATQLTQSSTAGDLEMRCPPFPSLPSLPVPLFHSLYTPFLSLIPALSPLPSSPPTSLLSPSLLFPSWVQILPLSPEDLLLPSAPRGSLWM